MDWWKVSVLPFSVVVDEAWNGKCSRYEVCNLASFGKHFDDLNLILSLLKFDFHIIGISEHKIHKNDCNSMTNIDLDGYHPFVFDPTETYHGGTGFYIKESLVYVRKVSI